MTGGWRVGRKMERVKQRGGDSLQRSLEDYFGSVTHKKFGSNVQSAETQDSTFSEFKRVKRGEGVDMEGSLWQSQPLVLI